MKSIHKELLPLLKQAIAEQQARFIDGISEYELLQILKNEPYQLIKADALSDSLHLFQTHFIVFHVLYQLRNEWLINKTGDLDIQAISIKFRTHLEKETLGQANISCADPLADYYLDWSNFDKTHAEEIDNLLDSFWQQMAGIEQGAQLSQAQIDNAIHELEITDIEDLDLRKLKQHYRKSQHKYHPDKGGSIQKSQKVIHAFTVLQRYIKRQD